MTRIGRCIVSPVFIALLCGCQYPLPSGFVKVPPPDELTFRAVSADGAAIALRTQDNPENGDLAFWEKAITARLVDYRGYKLAQRREISHADRTPGIELTFDYQRDGIDYTYVVTILVKGRTVYCIEIAGDKRQIAPQLQAIKDAVAKWPLS